MEAGVLRSFEKRQEGEICVLMIIFRHFDNEVEKRAICTNCYLLLPHLLCIYPLVYFITGHKLLINVHYNSPEAKVTSLNRSFCQTMMYNDTKQREAGTSEWMAYLVGYVDGNVEKR